MKTGPASAGTFVVSDKEGLPTLEEIEAAEKDNQMEKARSHPAVAALLKAFDGARIVDVRIKEPAIEALPPAPEEESDGASWYATRIRVLTISSNNPISRVTLNATHGISDNTERNSMKDILGMMKQAKEMQAKMAEMQESLAEVEALRHSWRGMVTVTLSGKGDLKGRFD